MLSHGGSFILKFPSEVGEIYIFVILPIDGWIILNKKKFEYGKYFINVILDMSYEIVTFCKSCFSSIILYAVMQPFRVSYDANKQIYLIWLYKFILLVFNYTP